MSVVISCKQFRINGVSNRTELGYFNYNRKLFVTASVKKGLAAFFTAQQINGSISMFSDIVKISCHS